MTSAKVSVRDMQRKRFQALAANVIDGHALALKEHKKAIDDLRFAVALLQRSPWQRLRDWWRS